MENQEDDDKVGPLAGEEMEKEEAEEQLGSSLTLERVAVAKQFIENHYKAHMKHIKERRERLQFFSAPYIVVLIEDVVKVISLNPLWSLVYIPWMAKVSCLKWLLGPSRTHLIEIYEVTCSPALLRLPCPGLGCNTEVLNLCILPNLCIRSPLKLVYEYELPKWDCPSNYVSSSSLPAKMLLGCSLGPSSPPDKRFPIQSGLPASRPYLFNAENNLDKHSIIVGIIADCFTAFSWRSVLEQKLASSDASEEEQINLLKDLERKETEYMRLKRHKICVDDFELLTIIGRGAFGEV
ncbi:AGC (cAMP-dependent, cGMP-dependent and protein kinase C) kinase family protein [Actinidia rufa]|uniref:AGC (cAMP-dependent, cGMP-dependent and protein kinase C) kinase family protein n=1 Tax=Actinidia rufa TaxID=165716 RepID=A0A7J0DVM4_9ERIC|nr:AGC (cAMP-dependent, cGMP-dependent and protein kinase C) kinase family protein [Actinidia rufa]